MPTIVKSICIALLSALTACSKLGVGQDDMTWAREALSRNERLEVVAADTQAKTFTVRLKESGQVIVIPMDQVVAGPAALLEPAQAAASAPPAEVPAASAESPAATAPNTPSAPASAPASPAGPAAPAPAAPTPASSEASGAPALADDEATRATESSPPRAQSAVNARPGSVLASGPGYTIKASGTKATSLSPSPSTAPRGAPERLHDPIICQGSRLLHIDNRNLEFDGDAITAEDGCEIHITNTHISAKGIGVLARAANVHIKNSEIDGASGAVDATDGAQVYAESSRFKGLTRRLESSAFHDLGGNVWN